MNKCTCGATLTHDDKGDYYWCLSCQTFPSVEDAKKWLSTSPWASSYDLNWVIENGYLPEGCYTDDEEIDTLL